MSAPAERAGPPACASCRHFTAGALALEQRIPGLRSFGSGFASVRAGDGLCVRRDAYLAAASYCSDWSAKPGA